MKRKLIDAFDREEQKAPRLEQFKSERLVPALPQPSASAQPMPTDVDLHNVMMNFVNIYEKLDASDELLEKPNYSYTELVYLAILRSPNFCLPIGEIYKYVQNRFVFFRNNTRLHWRNAIRHSLSKTKCFTKINLGRGSSGSSNRSCFLWSISPASIINFARGDYRPNVDRDSGTNTLRWGYYHTNAGNFWDQIAVVLENKIEFFKATAAICPTPVKVFQQQICNLPNQSVESSTNIPQSAIMTQSTEASPVYQPKQVITQQQAKVQSTPPPNVVCQPNGTIYATPVSTQSTPPPNVVCQPNGTIYTSATPAGYSNSTPIVYSSSTPIVFNSSATDGNTSTESEHVLSSNGSYSSPVLNDCSRLSSNLSSPISLPYDIGTSCYQPVSPPPSSSCMQSTPHTDVSQLWNQQSPEITSGSFTKDSGIELSCSDLESFQESIQDLIPLYETASGDTKQIFPEIDLSSYAHVQPSQRNIQETTSFPTHVVGTQHLHPNVIPQTNASNSAIITNSNGQYQPFSYTTYPQYNFSQAATTAIPNQVYTFNAATNSYQPVQWYQG
ncbi:uncharacterized protein LOC126808855 [Patella vulgata]|uniref:uncharacterized protein LOC126808855 n=1 Tax=Patella vulgata TaxID=6465 RepID=UPI0024A971F4|nr:uncharacterized protein LOC126808855 [Patella vulgata]